MDQTNRLLLRLTCAASTAFLLSTSALADQNLQNPWLSLWGNQIQYLGLYNYTTDSTQARWQRDFPKISSMTNLVFLDPNDPAVGPHLEPQVIVSRLVQSLEMVRAAGKKAILPADFAFTGSFFDRDRSLSPTFDQEWSTIYQPALAEYADTIVAFYPLDEPFTHMKDQTGAELEHEIATIKAPGSFPQWKAIGVFSSIEVNRGVISRNTGKTLTWSLKSIPAGYDWIGMDCYYPEFNHCGMDWDGEALPFRSIPEYYSILESLMTPDQQLVLVPTAATFYDPAFLSKEESKYFLFGVSNPRVTALLAYNYPSDPRGKFDRVGVQSLPAIQGKLSGFNQSYVNNPNAYYALSSATSNNVAPLSSATNAIDGSTQTFYSSNTFLREKNKPVAAGGVSLDVQMQTPSVARYLVLKARLQNGEPLGFPKKYQILRQDPQSLKWFSDGIFTTQPDSNGVVTLTLTEAKASSVLRIVPVLFGVDEDKNYAFQLAEIGILGEL